MEIRRAIITTDDLQQMASSGEANLYKKIPVIRIHSGRMAVEVDNTSPIPVEIDR